MEGSSPENGVVLYGNRIKHITLKIKQNFVLKHILDSFFLPKDGYYFSWALVHLNLVFSFNIFVTPILLCLQYFCDLIPLNVISDSACWSNSMVRQYITVLKYSN